MTDLDLRLVRYFVATAEELHFGRAAARLFISQQTLSSQIAKLELDVGVTLFDRTGRQVRLTSAGQTFRDECRVLLQQAQRSMEIARGARQVVRVASINDQIDTVPHILEACVRMSPDLRVETILARLPEQVRMVQSGELDLALGRAYRLPPGLSTQIFRLDRARVIALREQPLGESPDPLPWRAWTGWASRFRPRSMLHSSRVSSMRSESNAGFLSRLHRLVPRRWNYLWHSSRVNEWYSWVSIPFESWLTGPPTA